MKDFFVKNGVKITEPNVDDFKTKMQPVYDELIKKNGNLGQQAVDEITAAGK